MESQLLKCIVGLVLLSCCTVKCAELPKNPPCNETNAVRLDSLVENNTTCGSVEGRVQICEGEFWLNLCGSNWTLDDARVTCRSMGYSSTGAVNLQTEVRTTGSTQGVNCSGSEDIISSCNIYQDNVDGQCNLAIAVRCLTEESDCFQDATTMSTDSSAELIDETTKSSEPIVISTKARSNFFMPPTLYYFLGGLLAVVLAAILILVLILICCCGYKRRKGISPAAAAAAAAARNTESQEKEKGYPYGGEALEAKDGTTAHHQIQSQPIYEAIQSNENSSTHSQESPSSKPLVSTANELYSMLDSSGTYAQINPHIASPPPVSSDAPDPNSYYQQLNHKSSSLKRGLPNIPHQAVNKVALALEQGEEDERNLSILRTSGVVIGSSTSLPGFSSASHQPLMQNGLPNPSHHLEQVELRSLANSSSSKPSERNSFEKPPPPPPEYNTLEQIEECSQVSTAAVCNNNNNSPRFSHHSQQRLSGGFTSNHPRSATLPSAHSSPHSSRTSSLSSSSANSPQNSRLNRTLLGNPSSKQQKFVNKYSESPVLSRGPSNSPQIQRPIMTNRHSGQSDGNDVQSDLSDRDTLV